MPLGRDWGLILARPALRSARASNIVLSILRNFLLHDRLAQDSILLGDWPLCQIRLINNGHWPWLILVPRRANITELADLARSDHAQLMVEMDRASTALTQLYKPDKINIAMLGNVVSQMHWHIIARRKIDAAWPGPVWGSAAHPYDDATLATEMVRLRAALSPFLSD